MRVDLTGGLSYPADFDVYLDVDGLTYSAVPYNPALLPPINQFVQNDQNLGDQWDEFRFLWRGYGTGNHSILARAKLKNSSLPENSVPVIVDVPAGVAGPPITITTPVSGTTLTQPTQITVGVDTDLTARCVLAYINVDDVDRLIEKVNLPGATHVDLQATVGNYFQSDDFQGIHLPNGIYPNRAVAATGLDGSGIASEAQTTVTVTGFPEA
ncbi:MAG: hypothetical protein JJ992_19915, partial [Planctomycetes bacterium]|nr:hypothetical protein [Planctomycetota bacterium]